MDPHEREYEAAAAAMAETYGLPESHVSRHDGRVFVFWNDDGTRLRFGPVLAADDATVAVELTRTKVVVVPRSKLVRVPRFFGGGDA